MKRVTIGRRGTVVAAVTVAALALAGGIAYATIPGSDGVYSACMLKGVGTIRLIDKALPSTTLMSRCTDKEVEISWNQAGRPGLAGPAGRRGRTGRARDERHERSRRQGRRQRHDYVGADGR